MRRVFGMFQVLAIAASIALVGCAGGAQSLRVAQNDRVVDVRKMAAVEAVAQQKGVQVVWIHPPERRAD